MGWWVRATHPRATTAFTVTVAIVMSELSGRHRHLKRGYI
jgi:hypothetical protein